MYLDCPRIPSHLTFLTLPPASTLNVVPSVAALDATFGRATQGWGQGLWQLSVQQQVLFWREFPSKLQIDIPFLEFIPSAPMGSEGRDRMFRLLKDHYRSGRGQSTSSEDFVFTLWNLVAKKTPGPGQDSL